MTHNFLRTEDITSSVYTARVISKCKALVVAHLNKEVKNIYAIFHEHKHS